jgi:hypothetical protein
MRPSTLTILTLGVLLIGASAPATQPTESSSQAPAEITLPIVHVDTWMLLQDSGAELYHKMCASCHGVVGTGNGPVARSLSVHPPALNNLEELGVPKEHWTYVVVSSCDDRHHWGPEGYATMPCWKRVFRQTLGHEAAPMLVSAKLTEYLERIQVSQLSQE